MNSLYDAPRLPPVPVSLNKVTPVVPEVSMIFERKQTDCYNDWKRISNQQFKCTGQLGGGSQTSILKKSVRFENHSLGTVLENPFLQKNTTNPTPVLNEQPLLPLNLKGKTFEEIYMTNIPNRNLDLSILECKSIIEKENQQPVDFPKLSPLKPKTYKEFRTKTKSDCVTDIYNYRSPIRAEKKSPKKVFNNLATAKSNINKSNNDSQKLLKNTQTIPPFAITNNRNYSPKKSDNVTQTTIVESNDEPTLKDLFKIIQQQNEQIIQLQKQVLNLQSNNKNLPIEDVRNNEPRCSPSVPRNKTFSIDLTRTSFEVSFRPHQNLCNKKKDFVIVNEPKIQEITEIDSVKNTNGLSLNVGESFHVRDEACPSPEPSIKINMDDYHSSSDDESDSSESEDDTTSEVGITFYNKLMEQVNNMLHNAEIQTNAEYKDNKRKKAVTQQTMEKVKEATLKHLQSMGVNLPIEKENIQKNNRMVEVKQQKDYTTNDVNFEVKQLLMKYLPDEQLAKISQQKQPELVDKNNLIPLRPEFSFATVQYMKKYNLLNIDDQKQFPDTRQHIGQDPNALDITKLKLQPKLL